MMRFRYIIVISLLIAFTSHAYRYAIIIGHNDGGREVEKLLYAEHDARRFSQLLRSMAGFDADKIQLLQHPDSSAIEHAFQQVTEQLNQQKNRENTLFLFYYSGHANGSSLLLAKQQYSLVEIKNKINEVPSGISVSVFDACQSGSVTQFKGGKRAQPFYLQSQQQVKGHIVIASSAAHEKAQESDMLKSSIFTHHWINGLRGSADLSGDKKVTITEAYNYAYRKTVETTALSGGQVQHPAYKFNIHGQGDIALTNFAQTNTGVLFDSTFQGKFLILSEHYTDIFADFFKKSDPKEIFIALNPGKYTAINIQGTETRIHHFELSPQYMYQVEKESFKPNLGTIDRIKGINKRVRNSMEEETSPLSVFSAGLGIGGLGSIHGSLSNNNAWGKITFTSTIYIDPNIDLFINTCWIFPGFHFGTDIGLNFHWPLSKFEPFLGLGGGFYRFEQKQVIFNNEIGPSISLYMGLIKKINKRLQMQVSVPWVLSFNAARDSVIGLEISLLISGKYKNVKVLNK